MPRLHTLYLPNGRRSTPFAFILDQTTPMTEAAITAWQAFAEKCGALDIMLTAETIDIDPDREISDGWTPDDDEPVDYSPADHNHDGCEGHHIGLPDLITHFVGLVQAANDEAWVDWEPTNLDPDSPKVKTHREEACPALNEGTPGCPMHDPILEGGWVTWPYFASAQGVITRICEHGITHPTPEEYLGGFDTPHLCDGCPCAPTADFSIVVSDLANTKLPRGTLLLGVKDDPTPDTAPPATVPGWMVQPGYYSFPGDGLVAVRVPDLMPCDGHATQDGVSLDTEPCALGMGHRGFHLALRAGHLSGYFHSGDPIPVPDGEGPIAFVAEDMASDWVAKQDAYVGCGDRFQMAAGSLGCNLPGGHDGAHQGGGKVWYSAPAVPEPIAADLAAENWGTARIQPLGADGEPVGKANEYPLAGLMTIPTDQGEPIGKWETAEVEFDTVGIPLATLMKAVATTETGGSPLTPLEAVATTIENVKAQSRMAATDEPLDVLSAEVEDTPQCTAASNGARCTRDHKHEGLHTFNRV